MLNSSGNSFSTKHSKQWLYIVGSIGLLGLLLNIVFSLHTQAHFRYQVGQQQEWRQPFVLSEGSDLQLSRPIGNAVWGFDFTSLILMLQRLRQNSQGELILNANALDILRRASNKLPRDLSEMDIERLKHVLIKSFPDGLGHQMGGLMSAYRAYSEGAINAVEAINAATPQNQIALLALANQEMQQRQVRYFGDSAAIPLFAEENRTQFYLNKRRLIRLNKTLNRAQKKQALQKLQDEYTQSLKRD